MNADRARAGGACDESLARVAGNRAGVVEWANEAFGRLTGIPLAETVNKPVTRLLERAGIELEVVEFVAEDFFAGRRCRIELPFAHPDGRHIDVLLEVDVVRGEGGEIDGFAAVARERGDEPSIAPDTGRPARSIGIPSSIAASTSAATATRSPRGEKLDLSAAVLRVARRAARTLEGTAGSLLIDIDLAPDLGPIDGARENVERIVSSLLEAARAAITEGENAGGTLTLSTGRASPNRRFVSKVHAVPACPAERPSGDPIYLEVHDTGSPLLPAALERLARGGGGSSARERALARARECARRIGATLHLDSTPGCGNQALVLFPAADASASAPSEHAALTLAH